MAMVCEAGSDVWAMLRQWDDHYHYALALQEWEARLLKREAALRARELKLEAETRQHSLQEEDSTAPAARPTCSQQLQERSRRGGWFQCVRRFQRFEKSELKSKPHGQPRKSACKPAPHTAVASSQLGCPEPHSYAGSHARQDVVGQLLNNIPLPTEITSWDWPLTRMEKKLLVVTFDRQDLLVQRDALVRKLYALGPRRRRESLLRSARHLC
mmetsp:Transcript_29980/g.54620  ORF Transcript_29980/g.54620 Transcript_29980/m.54620 type:complete len:213 (-) Transcript_29980:53-691(-)